MGLEPSDDKEDQPRGGYPVLNSDKDAPINVGINLNKSSYRRGDTLELDVNVDRDSTYLACFYQDASKSITQVYPNPVQGASITSKK